MNSINLKRLSLSILLVLIASIMLTNSVDNVADGEVQTTLKSTLILTGTVILVDGTVSVLKSTGKVPVLGTAGALVSGVQESLNDLIKVLLMCDISLTLQSTLIGIGCSYFISILICILIALSIIRIWLYPTHMGKHWGYLYRITTIFLVARFLVPGAIITSNFLLSEYASTVQQSTVSASHPSADVTLADPGKADKKWSYLSDIRSAVAHANPETFFENKLKEFEIKLQNYLKETSVFVARAILMPFIFLIVLFGVARHFLLAPLKQGNREVANAD